MSYDIESLQAASRRIWKQGGGLLPNRLADAINFSLYERNIPWL